MIGSRIKKARKDIGFSQKVLAEKLGIKTQSIQQWESGKTSPRLHRLFQLSEILKVPFLWLQTGLEENSLANQSKSELENINDIRVLRGAFLKTVQKLNGLEWIELKRNDIPIDALADVFISECKEICSIDRAVNKKGV